MFIQYCGVLEVEGVNKYFKTSTHLIFLTQ